MPICDQAKAVRLGTLLLNQVSSSRVLSAFQLFKVCSPLRTQPLAASGQLLRCNSRIPSPKTAKSSHYRLRSALSMGSPISTANFSSRSGSISGVHSPSSLYAQLKQHLSKKAANCQTKTSQKGSSKTGQRTHGPRKRRPGKKEQVAVVSGLSNKNRLAAVLLSELWLY